MTETHIPFGREVGICPECSEWSGNMARHLPACRRRYQEFFGDVVTASPELWRAIERAAAHSAEWAHLAGEARFREGVTNLAVARVLFMLERGLTITLGSTWYANAEDDRACRSIRTAVVDEMLRTGLARIWVPVTGISPGTSRLVAANVHLRSKANPAEALHATTQLRTRLVDDRDLADCPECLAY